MIALGISGRRRRAAAAVAIDGRVVAAVTEASVTRVLKAGYRERGFPVRSVERCLEVAGLSPGAIDALVIADGVGGSRLQRVAKATAGCGPAFANAQKYRIGRLGAWAQLGVAAFESPVVIAADLEQASATACHREKGSLAASPLPAVSDLLSLALPVSLALGISADDPAAALSELEHVAATEPQSGPVSAGADRTPRPNADAFRSKLAASIVEFGDTLRSSANVDIKVQRARAELAGSFLSMLAAAIAHEIDAQAAQHGAAAVTLAGSVFGDPDFDRRISAGTSIALQLAPVPVTEGAALGAALAPFSSSQLVRWPDSMGLGPSFAESEVKAALENCRLDYIYEPRWPRLMERISRILATGKLVVWFQQSAEFGTSVGGSRSILCDPSNRYARDNINRFLRQQPEDAPIGVSMPAEASGCVAFDLRAPWGLAPATVAPDARDRLRAAVDSDGQAHIHVVEQASNPLFHELLTTHWQRTGVPGLLNTALHGVGEPVACSPRDAIRTMYSSAVDAMVLHRFLVMKDYWQMRGGDS